MKKQILLLIMYFISFLSLCQNKIEYKGEMINALDEQGRQTGAWKVYDDAMGVVIITEFNEGNVIAGPDYYKGAVLLAAIQDDKKIKIYKEGETIEAHFYTEPLKMPILVDNKGNQLDKEMFKYLLGPAYPMFYGGSAKLYDFIRKAIDHKALKGEKGKVVMGFVIDKIGMTSTIKVLESTNPKLNEEAKRLISILPRWQPAHQNGEFVRIAYTLPLTFN